MAVKLFSKMPIKIIRAAVSMACILIFAILFLVIGTEFFSPSKIAVMTSGRLELFRNCITFIHNNPLTGNGSWRYLDFYYRSPGIHSHNAFLQLIATHGLISALYLGVIFKRINKFNFAYILPIIVFNLFNFSMFYAFSFADIILFYFLSLKKEERML